MRWRERKYGVIGFGLGGYEVNAAGDPMPTPPTAAKRSSLLAVPQRKRN
ncbi:MAG: hypothetical protein R2911_45960 [Caldilineaceae bacterium]